jgi:hypothetical protein
LRSSNCKLKPLPPDPFRHQDSAIAPVAILFALFTIQSRGTAQIAKASLTGAVNVGTNDE